MIEACLGWGFVGCFVVFFVGLVCQFFVFSPTHEPLNVELGEPVLLGKLGLNL